MNTPSTSVDPWASVSVGSKTPSWVEEDGLAPVRGCLVGALLGMLAWGVAIVLALLWLR